MAPDTSGGATRPSLERTGGSRPSATGSASGTTGCRTTTAGVKGQGRVSVDTGRGRAASMTVTGGTGSKVGWCTVSSGGTQDGSPVPVVVFDRSGGAWAFSD